MDPMELQAYFAQALRQGRPQGADEFARAPEPIGPAPTQVNAQMGQPQMLARNVGESGLQPEPMPAGSPIDAQIEGLRAVAAGHPEMWDESYYARMRGLQDARAGAVKQVPSNLIASAGGQ